MDKEQFVINQFKSPFLGDDGVVIGTQVYSKDLFVEGVHFKRAWLNMREIGYKAMIVNFSDTIVMNAVPKYVLLGLGLPKSLAMHEIRELNFGIKQACKEYGVIIIGGDTISDTKISISVSVVGSLIGKTVERKGLRNGDLIAYTGKLGSSLKTLNTFLKTPKFKQNSSKKLGQNISRTTYFRACISSKSRFIKPILRDNFFYKAAKFMHSAMDISDGLEQDLPRLCKSARLSYKFMQKPLKYELRSGEEYEVLFSFSPKNLVAIKRIAAKTHTKITIFAKAVKGICKTNVRKHHF